HTPGYIDWMVENLKPGSKVGTDYHLISVKQANQIKAALKPRELLLKDVADLSVGIWQNRPMHPKRKIVEQPIAFAGKSRADKLKKLEKQLKKRGCTHHLLTALDDLAWLFNLRGQDIEFNPVFVAYGLVSLDQACLFIDPAKLEPDLVGELEQANIKLLPYESIRLELSKLKPNDHLYYDPATSSLSLIKHLPPSLASSQGRSLVTELKAVKNETEIDGLRSVMQRDGVAMVQFLVWLEDKLSHEKVTEVDAANALEEFRQRQSGFMGPSFGTIAGYGPNGAIVHYSAEEATCATLQKEGIFLLDSGGQYQGGTTDITRTICLGEEATNEQKVDFTRVLKGHIALARAIFPKGTAGHQLDILARQPLWENFQNFGHGTGHGVGHYLNVHEGPQRISPSATADYPLKPGMLTSNEPGIYHEGQYGIRIENLVLCVGVAESEKFGNFLGFETLTLCPIDRKLIEPSLLSPEEKNWLNQYHQRVFTELVPGLDETHQAWLAKATEPV
ncbi:MAG: aminopeptidase family protein P, partial [Bacteroidota bacterium]